MVVGEITTQFKDAGNKLINKFTVKDIFKYLLEGIAVALAAYSIPNRSTNFKEAGVIAAVAALSFFLLDLYAATVGQGARFGAGAGIGYNLVTKSLVPTFGM